MYICLDCGHHFEPGEEKIYKERHGFWLGWWESFAGCPLCRGAYEKARTCFICGGNFLEDELISDLCDQCIEDGVTVENTALYVLNCSAERDFYISHWTGSLLGRGTAVTPRLVGIVKDAWARYAEEFPDRALEVCRDFVLDDEIGRADFADWLRWKSDNHEEEEVP